MRRIFLVGLVGLSLLAVASPASASVILNTIEDTYSSASAGGSWTVNTNASTGNGQAVGLPFSSPTAATITGIEAYIGSSGAVELGVMNDASGLPSGTFINSTVVSLSGTDPVILSSLAWSIDASSTYWLVAIAQPGTFAGWYDASTHYSDWAYSPSDKPSNTNWAISPFGGSPEALITGDVGSAPLPGALPLFATSLGGLGLLGWRRKKKASAVAV